MISTKKCLKCQSSFSGTGQQKYCSSTCVAAAYRARYPNRVKESAKKYRENNIAFRALAIKEWRYKNKEHCVAYRKSRSLINREYWKNRRANDPIFRLKNNMRNRLKNLLNGKSKTSSVLSYIGCSVEELKKHLESLFLPNMTWENYGRHGWHIDHIRPLASFDCSKHEDLQIAWHYSNLQPLWAEDNLKKWCK